MSGGPNAVRPAGRPTLIGRLQERRQLKKRRLARLTRKQRILRRLALALTWGLGLIALALTGLAILIYSVSDVPPPSALATNQTATILYSDGSIMTHVGSVNRTIVPLSDVPQSVRDAVLAAEDRGFYTEPGISIRGTVRAALNNLTGGNRQGGSGITQQYVKNAYTDAAPTLSRKLKELAIALKLSREHSKDEILGYYLNTIYWGRGNTYGIASAAQAYFGVPVQKLTPAQGALLAGIIKAPNYYDPQVNRQAAEDRYNYVLDGLVSMGKLTAQQRAAMPMPKTIKARTGDTVLDGPLGLVKQRVLEELPTDVAASINTRGLIITTTIDRQAQSDAEQAMSAMKAGMSADQKKNGMRGALVSVNPANGAVVAYYGNGDGNGYDYANGYRPPGSSFKPYTLAAALDMNLKGEKDRYGKAYNIQSIFNGNQCVTIDGTRVCNDPSDAQYAGNRTLAFAMMASLNTTFDGLAYAIGPDKVRDMAWAAGIAKTNPSTGKQTLTAPDGSVNFGIGIGDADYAVRPIDQADGFASFANGGTNHPAFFVSKVTDSRGKLVWRHTDSSKKAMDPKVANDVTVTLKPIAAWSDNSLAGGRQSGSKTGTAGIDAAPGVPAAWVGHNSDAWTVGFTPQVSTAVWVGTGTSKPIFNAYGGDEYGRDLPGKAWKAFMDSYLVNQPFLPLPGQQQIFSGTSGPPTSAKTSAAPSTSATTSSASRSPSPITTGPTGPPITLIPPGSSTPPFTFPTFTFPSSTSASPSPSSTKTGPNATSTASPTCTPTVFTPC